MSWYGLKKNGNCGLITSTYPQVIAINNCRAAPLGVAAPRVYSLAKTNIHLIGDITGYLALLLTTNVNLLSLNVKVEYYHTTSNEVYMHYAERLIEFLSDSIVSLLEL